MKTTDVQALVGGSSMRMFAAAPEGGASRAVIVIPEAFGLNRHIESVAERLAGEGMTALAIDVFHRAGAGVAPYGDFQAAMRNFEGLDDAGLQDDLDAALEHLGAQGFGADSVAVVGFCFGGRVAFLAALERPLAAAVSYYGGGIVSQGRFSQFPPLIGRIGELRTPWLGLFGDRDRSISVDDVEHLREVLATAELAVPTEIVRYPDAEHGFNCDERPSYNLEASADAWQRMLRFVRAQA